MTINKMTKLMPVIVLAYPLSTSADPLASENLSALTQCQNLGKWLLIEVDSKLKQIQASCVDATLCPAATTVAEFNVGDGGDWLVCKPCDQAKCPRDLPIWGTVK